MQKCLLQKAMTISELFNLTAFFDEINSNKAEYIPKNKMCNKIY